MDPVQTKLRPALLARLVNAVRSRRGRNAAFVRTVRRLRVTPSRRCIINWLHLSEVVIMETPVILSAVRTPIGKFQGGLARFSAPGTGRQSGGRSGSPRRVSTAKQVDEVILGNVVQAGTWAESRAASGPERRLRSARRGDDDQQGVRFRTEGRWPGRARRAAWRKRNRRGGRHGVDVQLPVLAAAGAHGLPAGRSASWWTP